MYLLIKAPPSQEYELIDCGNYEKLERFGRYILWRPEPKALWPKKISEQDYENLYHARYVRNKKNSFQSDELKGKWTTKPGMPDNWQINYGGRLLTLHFKLALTSFGHIGLFPEQSDNWDFIYETVCKFKIKPKVLNLFAYTGGATLAAGAAGSEVVHLDSVKQTISWANFNKELNKNSATTHWVVEDALKFVKREVKRGKRYNGIIMDPPVYGRGPEGEKWLLNEQFNELLFYCSKLINHENVFIVINIYSTGLSALILDNLATFHFSSTGNEIGEIYITSAKGDNLPLGVFLRVRKLH
ncbi:MAG: class I SAM-dependent methyltransferase [Bacteroidia bacterium]|nr:class I SAM-dependent methyltransferase [Bacteroidia bacterium]